MAVTKIYRGWLHYISNGEDQEDEILSLVSEQESRGFAEDDALASIIENDMDEHGRYLTVRYGITDHEVPEDGLNALALEVLYGEGHVRYHEEYSEITGYLWTDQDLRVGGHDLLAELCSAIGRYVILEITYATAAR